jgi:membrane associated rhomboid family serine protease
MYLTLFIISLTSLISILAFNRLELLNKLKFNAYLVWVKKDVMRIFSHALVHSGWFHLIINMYVLWIFGGAVERAFIDSVIFPNTHTFGKFFYILMYVLAVPVSSIPALFKHKNNQYYNSVGASGAVSAIVFTMILLAPDTRLGILFIPLSVPAYIFGILYLAYSYFMSRRDTGNIAHDAHFVGSVFGFVFPIMLNPHLFQSFMSEIF